MKNKDLSFEEQKQKVLEQVKNFLDSEMLIEGYFEDGLKITRNYVNGFTVELTNKPKVFARNGEGFKIEKHGADKWSMR
jgi:hypothetical protein